MCFYLSGIDCAILDRDLHMYLGDDSTMGKPLEVFSEFHSYN